MTDYPVVKVKGEIMNVAVIGATGVLGRALIPLLLSKGHAVRALARSPQKIDELFGTQVIARECDLLADGIGSRLPGLLAGCDAVIHAATAIPPQEQFGDPAAWVANNRIRTTGITPVLEAVLEVGAECYLQQSICFSYATSGDEWITEEMPLDESRPTLVEMERQVREALGNRVRWSILRGGVFVGRDTFQDDAIAKLRAGTQTVPCDGSAYQSLIHVEDIAAAFVAALEHAPAGSVFNICDEPLRQGEYLDRLADAVGAARPARDPDAPCPPSQRCSNAAARENLGWQPTHGVIPVEV